jgi:hypothetical protein
MGAGGDGRFDLDRARLEALAQRLEQPAAEVAATLDEELVGALAQIDAGLRADDLAIVAHGAHAARNSALMLDAGGLLAGLRELEQAAARGEIDAARRARTQFADRAQRLLGALRAVG